MSTSTNPNRIVLQEAKRIQQQSKDVLIRCQQQLQDTELLGHNTIVELQKQSNTMDNITTSTDHIQDQIYQSNQLLNQYDRWNFHFFGRNQRLAKREVKQQERDNKLFEQQQQMKQEQGETKAATKHEQRVHSNKNNNNKNRSELFSSKQQKQKQKQRDPNTADHGFRNVSLTGPIDVDDTFHSSTTTTTTTTTTNSNNNNNNNNNDDAIPSEIQEIDQQDQEMDTLLDIMIQSLDQLHNISHTIQTATQQSNKQMDSIVSNIQQVQTKQSIVQHRIRRHVTKK